MRIAHFSDWHGGFQTLPLADLYVCTGDMLPNTQHCYAADKTLERAFQDQWIRDNASRMAKCFPLVDPTVLCVRGNHDFADLVNLFPGTVFEFTVPSTFKVAGLTFGGFRGVPPINGVWADEISETELEARALSISPDVWVTHSPRRGCLDLAYSTHLGSRSLAEVIDKRGGHHLFGHIHECGGMTYTNGYSTVSSNAAGKINTLDLWESD
jgi:Icc-related predicted phosphoesterase